MVFVALFAIWVAALAGFIWVVAQAALACASVGCVYGVLLGFYLFGVLSCAVTVRAWHHRGKEDG